MFHDPKPFYKSDRNAWYVEIDRKQVKLSDHPADLPPPEPTLAPGKTRRTWHPPKVILDAFYQARGRTADAPKPAPPAKGTTVVQVLDYLLDWCQTHRSPRTADSYRERLQSFTDYLKDQDTLYLTVEELRPFHVRQWADSHADWNPGMKRGRMGAV